MTRKLTRKRQLKYNKYKKTRCVKYIKKRRSMTRRRVLRGGVVILKREQREYMNCFFDSLHDDSNNDINENGEPSYYSSYDKALFCLNKLFTSLGQILFIQMLGGNFKQKYNSIFYNEGCLARLRLIKFLSYIYDRISNGDTISQDTVVLDFIPSIYTKHSAIPMLQALLCSADGQCLNTTSYVATNFGTQGRELIAALHANLTNLVSSDYMDKKTRDNITENILPSIEIDKMMLALNPTILCSILKNMLSSQ